MSRSHSLPPTAPRPTTSLTIYPAPLIIDPLSTHTSSWIILHGRGDTAESFAQGLFGFLSLRLPDGKTIQHHLPNTKFIFPSARPRRSRIFGGEMTQWFDCASYRYTDKSDWEVEGLRETTEHIHKLIRQECKIVDSRSVVLGGLSQGCASSLIAILLWEGEPLKAVVGMSGWLPMKHILSGGVESAKKLDSQEDEEMMVRDGYQEAVKALCGELEIREVVGSVAKNIPIFLGHGKLDDIVELDLGEIAREVLKASGLNVSWRVYERLDHWMCGEELADVVGFVAGQVGEL